MNPSRTIRPPGSSIGLRAPQSGLQQNNHKSSVIGASKLRFSSPIQTSSNKSPSLIGLPKPGTNSSAIPHRRPPLLTQTPQSTNQVRSLKLPQSTSLKKLCKTGESNSSVTSNPSVARSSLNQFQPSTKVKRTNAASELKSRLTHSKATGQGILIEPKKLNKQSSDNENNKVRMQSDNISSKSRESNNESNNPISIDALDQHSGQLDETSNSEPTNLIDNLTVSPITPECQSQLESRTIVNGELLDSVRDIYQLCEKLKVQLMLESDFRKALEEKNRQLTLVIEKQKNINKHN